MREINLTQTPFTCKNSYMVISRLSENYQNLGNAPGLYLRTIHNSTITPLIAGIVLKGAKETAYLDRTALFFSGDKDSGGIECCYADSDTMLIRGSEGTGIVMDFLRKWTGWWMDYRRKDGLYYYNHGNDSGWDNSTAFSKLPPLRHLNSKPI